MILFHFILCFDGFLWNCLKINIGRLNEFYFFFHPMNHEGGVRVWWLVVTEEPSKHILEQVLKIMDHIKKISSLPACTRGNSVLKSES